MGGLRRWPRPLAAAAVALAATTFGIGTAMAVTATARFERLTVEDGLSQASVNCVAQDDLGFLWFGTQDGLNRFDGYEFTVYRHDAENPGSLAHSFVWDLLVDDDGALWIATDGGGLDRLEPSGDTFRHYRSDPGDSSSLPNDRVRALEKAAEGRIWVGTDSGLARFDPETGRFERIALDPQAPASDPVHRIRALRQDGAGRLWIGTDGGGLVLYEHSGDRVTRFRNDPADPRTLSNDRIRSVITGPGGSIWIGTYEGGLNRLDPGTGTIVRTTRADGSGLAHDRVRALLAGSDGSIWVGTDGGLNRIRTDSPVMASYHHEPADPHSLANDRILSLFQDDGGVIWVATQAGLSRWNPTATFFEHIRQTAADPDGLPNNVVNAITEGPDGRLWVGTFDGLSAVDRESGRHLSFRRDPSRPASLADNRVMVLRWSRSGALWVGTMDGGLDRYDPATGRFSHYRSDPEDPSTLGSNGVTSILEDRAGRLWVGCYRGGLSQLDPVRGTFVRHRPTTGDPSTLSDDRVMTIAEDRSGVLWIGTDGGGLNRLDPVTGRFTQFANETARAGGLASDVVWSIHEGRDGTLWIGTQGGGLFAWAPDDRAAGRFRVRAYTERSGLPNASVYGILEDDDENLWLSTNRGLSRFDPRSETFLNFGPSAGLQGLEFNFGAYHRAASGEMFFGGSNGLNAFHPSRIRRNEYAAPLRLTRILGVEGDLPLAAHPWRLGALELDHRQRVVAFEFAALDFTSPARTRYAYRLEGFNQDWIELGTTRRATYTNLPSGQYVLRVRATKTDGTWNEAGLSLPIVMRPPWWAGAWAWCIYVLAALSALLGLVRIQSLRARRREEYQKRLEEEVRLRTNELAEANDRLRETSLTDALTGLRNRRYVLTTIRDEMAGLVREHLAARGAERGPDPLHKILFVMLDLDGFKQVNDTHGHETGDRVLNAVRDAILLTCRRSDTLVRWGGDEFLLICRNTAPGGAAYFIRRIQAAVAAATVEIADGVKARVGCSIGFAYFPPCVARPDAVTWEVVQGRADAAMYEAKRSGKNRWVGFLHAEDGLDLVPADAGDLPEGILGSVADDAEIRIVRGGGELFPEVAAGSTSSRR